MQAVAEAQKLEFDLDTATVRASGCLARAAKVCNAIIADTNQLDTGQFCAVMRLLLASKGADTFVLCCIAMVVVPLRAATNAVGEKPQEEADERLVETTTNELFHQLMPIIHSRLATIPMCNRIRALRVSADIEDVVRVGVLKRLKNLCTAGSVALAYWIEAAKASTSAWVFYEEFGGRDELQIILARSAGLDVFLQHAAGAVSGYSIDFELKSTVRSQTDCIRNWMARLQATFPASHQDFCFLEIPEIHFRL
jgi:hypothetical protein